MFAYYYILNVILTIFYLAKPVLGCTRYATDETIIIICMWYFGYIN